MNGPRFAGRVALVTGGGGAIGAATAERLAHEGAAVMVVDRDAAAVDGVVLALEPLGARVAGCYADVSDEDDVERMVAEAGVRFGAIDVFALIAGIGGARRRIDQLAASEWDAVIETNLRSTFLGIRAGARALIDQGRAGAIVTMASSMARHDVLDGGSAYAASKGGVLSLTRAAAFDLAPHGIRVNAVCPGVVDTALGVPADDSNAITAADFAERIPLHRIGLPADVAAAVAYLASNDAAHLTGSELLIDGGQTLQSWANSPR